MFPPSSFRSLISSVVTTAVSSIVDGDGPVVVVVTTIVTGDSALWQKNVMSMKTNLSS